MGFFDLFRLHGGPTLYPSNKTPVTVDVLLWGLVFAIVIVFLSFVTTLPGFKEREKWNIFSRTAVKVFVLSSIVVCNFGQDWEVAEVHNVHTHYKAGIPHVIKNASVAVRIGLRCVNITLKTDPVRYKISKKVIEVIDYNERFTWNDEGWTQGRIGFGHTATQVNKDYRAAQLKGVPFPIMWIAEYFTIDGEGIRWGRFYREAGYYTHCLLWLGFSTWIVSIFLFNNVLLYAAYSSIITGLVLLLGNIIYASVRNPLQLEIHVGDSVLQFHWGWPFWLNLSVAFVCLSVGSIVWFMYEKFPMHLYHFFNVDILQDIEEYYYCVGEFEHDEKATPLHPSRAFGAGNRHVDGQEPYTILRGVRRHDYYLSPLKGNRIHEEEPHYNTIPDHPNFRFLLHPNRTPQPQSPADP